MSDILSNTRLGAILEASEARVSPNSSPEIQQQALLEAQNLCLAAMGVEYIAAAMVAKMRPLPEALTHWIEFCKLIHPASFATREKAESFRAVFMSALRDARDISSGKI